ncbi:hypothetical protein ABZ543_34515 [Streptomyces roseifaciens]
MVPTGEDEPPFRSVTLVDGRLLLGDTVIPSVRLTRDHVSWVHRSGGLFTSGHLYFHEGGAQSHGVVFWGGAPDTARQHGLVGHAIHPRRYETSMTVHRHPQGEDPRSLPPDAWHEGLTLEVSYDMRVGDEVPRLYVVLSGHDISEHVTFEGTGTACVRLRLRLPQSACRGAGGLYADAFIDFPLHPYDAPGSGRIARRCGEDEQQGLAYLWKTRPVHQGEAGTAALATALSGTGTAAAEAPAPPGLSLAELMTLLPDQETQQFANLMLLRNMKWAMGQDGTQRKWLKDFLGAYPPEIPQRGQRKRAEQGQVWFRDSFAKAYLAKSFDQTEHRLNGLQRRKLEGYFTTGLGASKDFTLQYQGIYTDALIEAHPRLQDYIDDDGPGWAEKLHVALTEPAQLRMVVNRIRNSERDRACAAPLTQFSTLLTALSPDGKYGVRYTKSVTLGLMAGIVPRIRLGKAGGPVSDPAAEWIPLAFENMLRAYAAGKLPEQDDLPREQATSMANDVAKHALDIGKSLAAVFKSLESRDLIRSAYYLEQQVQKTFAERWPRLMPAARFFLAVAWIGGIAMIIVALTCGKWEGLSSFKRQQLVLQSTQAAIKSFDNVPVLYRGAKNLGLKAWRKLQAGSVAPEALDSVELAVIKVSPSAETDWMIAAAAEVSGHLRSDMGKGSLWEELLPSMKTVGRALKFLGVAVAVSMTVISGMQLYDEFKKHDRPSRLVWDTLIFAVNTAATVFMVAGMFWATSWIPIAGAALALAGVIITLLAWFLDKPESPVAKWFDDVGVPFVDRLPGPSAPQAALA